MAARYWVGTDTSWNTSANWSTTSGGAGGAGVPTSSDDVYFDSASSQNCTCDVAISVSSITNNGGYTASFDLADSSYSHSITNDLTIKAGTFDLGDSTITCGGHWTMTTPSITYGTSTVKLTGTTKDINIYANRSFYDLQIVGQIRWVNSYGNVQNKLTVDSGGTFTLSNLVNIIGELANNGTIVSNNRLRVNTGTTITAWGSISGTGRIEIYGNGSFTLSGAVWNVEIRPYANGGTLTFVIGGNSTFNGHFNMFSTASGSVTISNTGNYDLIFADDISDNVVNTLTWSKGTGTITASGTANQSWDFNGESVEDIDIDKSSGTVTLTGDVDPDTVTVTSGTLDIDGNTLTTTGNYTMSAGTTTQDTAATGSISIGGNLDINGSSPSPCIWSDADITSLAAGTNDADWTTVSNSNNSSGNAIDATTNCTDSGGNTGWTFSAVGSSVAPLSFFHGTQHGIR